MILTGPEIKKQIELGHISIDPFIPENVGENAIDMRLSNTLRFYVSEDNSSYRLIQEPVSLDMRRETKTIEMTIPERGLLLRPGILYLGNTIETIHSDRYVSHITGRSSVGRLGLAIHWTAGIIDVGFRGQITLEMVVVQPLMVYPNVRICQLLFEDTIGEKVQYKGRYQNQSGPVASRGFNEEHGSFSETRK
ncbi:hypothetical protein LCGC14_3050410 [marine sediment metagenome]|uniref:Uncharacterized protein n=1 Tax=marine sediment metagenome TaxID=412755 RepID=A0A0F8YUV7_9ZZZZ